MFPYVARSTQPSLICAWKPVFSLCTFCESSSGLFSLENLEIFSDYFQAEKGRRKLFPVNPGCTLDDPWTRPWRVAAGSAFPQCTKPSTVHTTSRGHVLTSRVVTSWSRVWGVTCCRVFEMVSRYCEAYNNLIPIAFVLGFYVSLVLSRWWEQFNLIPWPGDSRFYGDSTSLLW